MPSTVSFGVRPQRLLMLSRPPPSPPPPALESVILASPVGQVKSERSSLKETEPEVTVQALWRRLPSPTRRLPLLQMKARNSGMVKAGCEIGTLCLWISIRQNPSQGHSLDRKCTVPGTRPP